MARVITTAGAVAALTTLAAGVSPSSPAWWAPDSGLDFKYNDIVSFDLPANDTKLCFDACVATLECVGWVMAPAGCNGANATCWLKQTMADPTVAECRLSGYIPTAVQPRAFNSPPVGSVGPVGWMQNELWLQSQGLSGFLFYFWPDIQASVWIGGAADTGLHERGPYWLNGIVPLSYQLVAANNGSTNLTAQMATYIDFMLANQSSSGWLGPDDITTGDEYWARFNVLQSFLQHYEGSGDERIIPAVFAYLNEARNRMLNVMPLGDWAAARGQDFQLTTLYLLDHWDELQSQIPAQYTPAFLITLGTLTYAQMVANGADWKTWFDTDAFPTGPACNPLPCSLLTHGVNIGQAIKSGAVQYRFSSDLTDMASTYIRISKLDQYHGMASGVFGADEHLAGNMPSHGTELCNVVESMFSYESAAEIIGDPYLFERAERIAYNALPATMTKDMWAHQYLQQPNEMNAIIADPHVWITDGPDSTLYGLAPNYGCCTANMHQGWPKFLQRMVQADTAGGVAVAMWGPVTATLTLSNGAVANVTVTTDYPFGDVASVSVSVPVPTNVSLRIPSWADATTITVDGAPATTPPAAGTFWWQVVPAGSTTFHVAFNPAIRIDSWVNGTIAIHRGALLYGIQIGENFTTLATYAFKSADYAVNPTTPWNYALVVPDLANPASSLNFTQLSRPGTVPYSATAPPVRITGQARLLTGWVEVDNAAAAPPSSPINCTAPGACGPLVPITLVPFGSTHLRMAEVPYTTA